ncbi:MAG TPA: methyl-accepting chemotaxis protein [Verrucomicrobiae bacterium]|nr:methyl-accepting chemotaxis protein [Verrucomicrobiae bacterium]
MKPKSLRQRLNTVVLLLTAFLLVGIGLAMWMGKARFGAVHLSDQLTASMYGIYYDVMVTGEALRNLALDPKSELERKRLQDAEDDLKTRLNFVQSASGDSLNLQLAIRNVHDFAFGPGNGSMATLQSRVLEMAERDPANAVSYFNAEYPGVSKQRAQVFGELAHQIEEGTSVQSQRARTISIICLLSLCAVLAASLLVGWFQSSTIAEPLNRLVTTLERMRQGDFSERLSLEQNDEFGLVGRGLNHLAEDLSGVVGQVQRSGIQVNTTALEIAASAKEQQSTAHEIAATTAQIGATSKEISATSKELVRTMNEVNHVAEQTAQLAGSGQAAITRMENTMRQIMEAAGSISSKLAVLSDKTANINSVVTTITKVADQTNLLSLNAAIEAEKAGEYGLGFAVVAMEIRRLADQTAVATYDIEKMVKEMQSAVSAGVMGMDKFSEEVRRGVEDVRQVSSHLAQIIHQVQTLTPRFQTVNEGMHAQATGAQQISETLSQLSEAAQQTAESLRQSNLAIEQLNGAARGLQASVARFKLTDREDAPGPLLNGPPLGL